MAENMGCRLEIRYVTDEETVQAVNDITFLWRGRKYRPGGETGAGRILRPWDHGAGAGSARRDRKGIDLFEEGSAETLKQMRRIRSGKISDLRIP
ncbi:MAG: hypothetical protein ACLRNW_09595 [Neglectibacter sp.]